MNRRTSRARMSRRQTLQIAGAAGVAALSGASLAIPLAAQDSSSSFPIPEAGSSFPTEDITFRFMSQGPGPRSPFYQAFFDAYGTARPNVTIQFDELPNDQISEVMSLALQNNEAPDLFFPAGAASNIGLAVNEGWLAPLDDIIPDFETWKSQFPSGALVEGVTQFGGKTYTFPLASNKRHGTMLFYNPAYLQEAGIDPATTALTWSTLRESAKVLTEQGSGQYFGLSLGGDPSTLADIVNNLAVSAGAAGGATLGGHMDWLTGEYTYTRDEYLAAIDLLLGLQADGSLVPGMLSMTERDAEPHVPGGTAAMTINGPWVIARWQAQFADFVYGLAGQPLPDSGDFVPLGHGPGGANYHVVSSTSDYQQVAGDILSIWGSVEGQQAFQSIVGGSLLAIFPDARQNANLDDHSIESIAIFDSQMRLHPDPRVRGSGVGQVYLEHQGIQPTLGDILQGVLSGQLPDAKAALQDLDDRANAELDRAIEAARANGADVSRDDWVFPNWDPMSDYGEAEYAELGN